MDSSVTRKKHTIQGEDETLYDAYDLVYTHVRNTGISAYSHWSTALGRVSFARRWTSTANMAGHTAGLLEWSITAVSQKGNQPALLAIGGAARHLRLPKMILSSPCGLCATTTGPVRGAMRTDPSSCTKAMSAVPHTTLSTGLIPSGSPRSAGKWLLDARVASTTWPWLETVMSRRGRAWSVTWNDGTSARCILVASGSADDGEMRGAVDGGGQTGGH
eukprot:scaffold289328_cov37-Tisochrysis_lutea.AAC.1